MLVRNRYSDNVKMLYSHNALTIFAIWITLDQYYELS